MSDLYLLYLFFVSVFVVLLFVREVLVWKMVQVGRWSVIGGEMVPAVICMVVQVVSVGSMSVEVPVAWWWRVGVVMVVVRPLWLRKSCSVLVILRRSRLRSPCIVIMVVG